MASSSSSSASTSTSSRPKGRSLFGLWLKRSSANVDIEAQNSNPDCTNMIDDFFGVTYPKEDRSKRSTSTVSSAIQLPSAPSPIYTSPSTRSRLSTSTLQIQNDNNDDEQTSNAILDFFGVSETPEQRRVRLGNDSTHASRHDTPPSRSPSTMIEIGDVVPPPYDLESQTDYSTIVENSNQGLPSYETVSSSAKLPSYPHPEPYTMPQFFFKYGFFCPLLWLLGTCLLVNFHHPLELARLYGPQESAIEVARLRAAELRWAKRCLLAFVIFTLAVLLIVGMVYGIVVSAKV